MQKNLPKHDHRIDPKAILSDNSVPSKCCGDASRSSANIRNLPEMSIKRKVHCGLERKTISQPINIPPSKNFMLAKIECLRAEIKDLRSNLGISEGLRKEMAMEIKRFQEAGGKWDKLSKVMKLDSNRSIKCDDDHDIGLLWNLSNMTDCFKVIDRELATLNHASRGGCEHPMVIMSKNHLEIGSFPLVEDVESKLSDINKAFHVDTNMVDHVVVPQKEVDISAGFAGVKGNLIWFNSGETDLMFRLVGDKVTKSIVLEPGFGFCVGKRDRYIRVLLFSFVRASDKFQGPEVNSFISHALFFGSDAGDEGSWLCELNVEDQAVEWSNHEGKFSHDKKKWNNRKRWRMKDSDRISRLGIESKNFRRNQIRIAPMRGSDMPLDLLAGKIVEVEKWVRDTLRCVKSGALPKTFNVTSRKEHPPVGDPFDIFWVDFDFNDELWDDEVMWDIRYLLMGSKFDKLPGFPFEIYDIREKLYVTRDGISERERGPRMD